MRIVRRLVAALGLLLLTTACGAGQASFKTPPRVVAAGTTHASSSSTRAPGSVTPGPTASSPSPSNQAGTGSPISISNVGVASVAAMADTGAVGFSITLDPAVATAQVGPGWAIQGGSLVPIFSGGTVSLPTSVSAGTAPNGAPWPVVMAVANTTSWSTATSATVVVTVPEDCGPGNAFQYPLTACPTGPAGHGPPVNLTNALTRLAVVGESFQFYLNGALEQESYPNPTWLLYQNTDPHVTWSGGNIGSGTPTYNP